MFHLDFVLAHKFFLIIPTVPLGEIQLCSTVRLIHRNFFVISCSENQSPLGCSAMQLIISFLGTFV